MYVALVPNRNSPPAYLLREGYREDGKVKSRTLANLSHWPLAKIERLRRVLRDEVLSGATEGLTMLRSLQAPEQRMRRKTCHTMQCSWPYKLASSATAKLRSPPHPGARQSTAM